MAKNKTKSSKKNSDKLVEELVENCLLQVALAFIPEDFKEEEPDEDDVQNIVDFVLPAAEEMFRSLLASCACGYFGAMMDAEDEVAKAA